MRREFYTYVLSRPDGTPFYVGKGHGKRYLACGGNQHAQNIYKKIIEEDGKVGLTIIYARRGEDEALAREKVLIRWYGRADQGRGSLVNLTDGGDGLSNPSIEIRAKMRIAKKIRPVRSEFRPGHQPSPEARIKMSIASKGHPPNSGSFKPGRSTLGYRHSKESKLKMSTVRKGRPPHQNSICKPRPDAFSLENLPKAATKK